MKNTHFILVKPNTPLKKKFLGAFIGEIDGKESTNLKDFLVKIGEALHFPDYDGKNLDALDEMLNDLEWIKQEKVIIHIRNTSDWLSREKSSDKILTLIDIFDATAEDWEWMDEEDEQGSKIIKIVFDDSERIRTILDEQEIPFAILE
jgi:RNAse (barnase) inhibitor barstar